MLTSTLNYIFIDNGDVTWSLVVLAAMVVGCVIWSKVSALFHRDAEFIGYQETVNGDSFPLFNVIKKCHHSYGSTVSINKLRELGLRVPKHPRKEIVMDVNLNPYVPCDKDCIHRDKCESPLKGSVNACNCEELEYGEEVKEMEKSCGTTQTIETIVEVGTFSSKRWEHGEIGYFPHPIIWFYKIYEHDSGIMFDKDTRVTYSLTVFGKRLFSKTYQL